MVCAAVRRLPPPQTVDHGVREMRRWATERVNLLPVPLGGSREPAGMQGILLKGVMLT